MPTNLTDGLREEYVYTPWDVLDGYPYIGKHGVYIGGGYVVRMKDPDALPAKMQQLYDEAWIDRYMFMSFCMLMLKRILKGAPPKKNAP